MFLTISPLASVSRPHWSMVKLAALARQPLHQKGWRRIHKLHVLKEKVGVTETLLPFLTGEGFLALPFETFLICAKKRPY